jgi:hypothetical protein
MARDQHGVTIAQDVFLAAAFHRTVKVAGRCGHVAYFDPHGLWEACRRRQLDMRFWMLRNRVYCQECLARGVVARPVVMEQSSELPTITLPMPDEREWKQALRRFR